MMQLHGPGIKSALCVACIRRIPAALSGALDQCVPFYPILERHSRAPL
jgi:hypothetical protein